LPPKIAIVEEGGFPVDIGGVSTWVKELVQGLKDFEFTVVTITTREKTNFMFKVPKGIEVKVHVLFSRKWRTKGNPMAFRDVASSLKELFLGEGIRLERLVSSTIKTDPTSFLSSREFWFMAKNVYEELDLKEGFIEFAYGLARIFHPILESIMLGGELKGFDLIHSANAGLAGLVGSAAKVKWGIPLVITEHGSFLRELDIWLERAEEKVWLKELLRKVMNSVVKTNYLYADVIASVSESLMRNQIRLGVPREKLLLIRNGIDASRYGKRSRVGSSGSQKDFRSQSWSRFEENFVEAAKAHSEECEEVLVVTISRVDKVKGIDLLARAAALVLSSGMKLNFEVIGPISDRKYMEEILSLIRELRISKYFKILGTTDVKKALSKADIFVLPSRSEGCPFALLEAMATGLPIIGTDVGGVPEVLGDAGILVRPEPKEIALAIEKLAKDAELRRKLGKNARERVLSNFQLEEMINSYRNLYLSLVGEKKWSSSA